MRSSPIPVSMLGAGSGSAGPSGCWSNCMKTRFQTSMKRRSSVSGFDGPLHRGQVFTEIEVDLAAGPARPGVAHAPEVFLFAQPQNSLGRDADPVAPDRPGLVVRFERLGATEHGRPEALLGKTVDLRDQFPGVLDRLVLEVVAEGEIAQHLEEGVVSRRAPHRLQVVVLSETRRHFWDVAART